MRLPPSLRVLWRACNERHSAESKSRLTGAQLARAMRCVRRSSIDRWRGVAVVARALTKHCTRSSEGFWGSMDGAESAKNVNALRALCRIVDDLAWMNVHALPHGLFVFEVRCAAGYGARWHLSDAAPPSFRGFVEPPLADGHDRGWMH